MEILHVRATVGPSVYSVDIAPLVIVRVRRKDGEPHGVKALGEEALRLQQTIGFSGRFLEVEPLREPNTAHVIFDAFTAEVGSVAARAALSLLDGSGTEEQAVDALRAAWRESRLLLSTQALVDEAATRGIPHLILNRNSLVQLGYGCNQQRIQDTLTEFTTAIGVDLAGSKWAFQQMLRSMSMPVPRSALIHSEAEVDDALREIGYPVVVKPQGGNQGKGVTTGIKDRAAALAAFSAAREFGSAVLVEEHVSGQDFRILVIDNRFVAASLREPASVVGDGERTICQLIEAANRDPRRGYDHEKPLTRLALNVATLQCLKTQGLEADSIPESGRKVLLQSTANLSTGGSATDVTDEVHPENIHLFERVAHLVGLDVAGLDVVAPDLRTPLGQGPRGGGGGGRDGGRLIEANAAPGFRMHLHPSSGIARNVCAPVIDKLFPAGEPCRVPILAVTGTNGKTTTTRLLSHLMQAAGRRVGFSSSDGIYMGGHCVRRGDCTDEFATWTVLKDPWVNTAVFEYPRGGIIRAGLGFDGCDVGVVLNVAADHLGSRDVHTIEDMARVKAVVARSVRPSGVAVLNADDDHAFAMREGLCAPVALFSLRADNSRLAGAEVRAVLADGQIVLQRGQWIYPVAKTVDVPLTFGGRAVFQIQNALAASLAAFCQGLTPAQIRQGLVTFDPGFAQTPGRMNYFYGNGFRVLVDYAHNLDSMQALQRFLSEAEADAELVGVLGGTGDRLDADIIELGRQSGRMFKRLVIREDNDTRGRGPGETAELVRRGAVEANANLRCEVMLDPLESVRYAINTAKKDDLICVLGGDVGESLDVVRALCRPTR